MSDGGSLRGLGDGPPDWVIELGCAPSERDPTVDAFGQLMPAYFARLRALRDETAVLNALIRDAAARGVTRHELAAQLHLGIEAVDAVLAGGSLVTFS